MQIAEEIMILKSKVLWNSCLCFGILISVQCLEQQLAVELEGAAAAEVDIGQTFYNVYL